WDLERLHFVRASQPVVGAAELDAARAVLFQTRARTARDVRGDVEVVQVRAVERQDRPHIAVQVQVAGDVGLIRRGLDRDRLRRGRAAGGRVDAAIGDVGGQD